MDTTPIRRRQPSVQVNEHSGFALELAAYLRAELKDRALSGRQFADLAAAGTHDHWAKIIARTKVMTTNDVKVAAEVLGMDPYTFVANSKVVATAQNIGGRFHDEGVLDPKREELLRSDVDLAALRGRNDAEVGHIE